MSEIAVTLTLDETGFVLLQGHADMMFDVSLYVGITVMSAYTQIIRQGITLAAGIIPAVITIWQANIQLLPPRCEVRPPWFFLIPSVCKAISSCLQGGCVC